RYRAARVQFTCRFVDHGLLRAVRAVRGNAGCDSTGDKQLAVADFYVCLYDGFSVHRRARHVSGWHSAYQLEMQDTLAIMIVLAAAAFLVWRVWQWSVKRRGGACGACSNCPSNPADKSPTLVSISPIGARARPQSGERSTDRI